MLSVSIVKRLDGFTLDAAWTGSERVVALLGPSGSGKTLTLSCLAGIVSPDRGRIALDGAVLFDSEGGTDVPTRDRRLGYVLQGYALFPHLTVAQNIGYGLLGWPKARRADRVVEVLGRLGLADLAHRDPRELSGGQQQRVALGRALAPDPAILLLDEPLSALDAPLRRQLRAELVATLQDWGKTTVLVTHDLAEAYELADQIIVYDRGRVLQSASRRDVVRRPSSEAVARIMGMPNILRGTVVRSTPERIWLQWRDHLLEAVNPPGSSFLPSAGRAVSFHVRPELVRLIRKDRPSSDPTRHRNLLEAVVVGGNDLGIARVLAVRIEQGGEPAQGDADLEIEMSPLVYEMLEVDHHRRWQLSIQPAGIHVWSDGEASGQPSPAVVEPRQSISSSFSSPVERRALCLPGGAGVGVRPPNFNALAVFGGGAVIGILGGLIGLGGAEFRLPLLIGLWRFGALEAVILNKALSLVVVATALPFRTDVVSFREVLAQWGIIATLLSGSVVGAWCGAGWATRMKSERLYKVLSVLLVCIAGVLLLGHGAQPRGLALDGWALTLAGVVAGVGIGIVASLLGVAGGELLIPTIVLLFGADLKVAGSLSLAVSLPTMMTAFTRYSRDQSFQVIRRQWRFIVIMAAGSIAGTFVGGKLLGFVPTSLLLPLLVAILLASAVKVWRHSRGRVVAP